MSSIEALLEDLETAKSPPLRTLAAAPIVDDWLFHTNSDEVWIVGTVDGLALKSQPLTAIDREYRWAQTDDVFWRLGLPAGASPKEAPTAEEVDALLENLVAPREDPRPGIVVLAKVGGTTVTTAAREAHAEFKAIAGVRLPLIQVPDLRAARRTLVGEFPHAAGVVDRMLGDLAGREAVRFMPTLLVGPAGCGKSRLARRIGEVCGIHVGRYDGAAASDSSFGGTSRRWSSGEPSKPLAVIKDAMQANPMLLIDEIDKCGTSRHNGNFVNAILTVIEVETAKRYPDPYVDALVDLANISFVLTANDDTGLPATLKDRCRLLRMPPITAGHIPALARAVVADLAAERGLDPRWVMPLDGDEIEIATRLLDDGSIRRLRSIVDRLLSQRETSAPRN